MFLGQLPGICSLGDGFPRSCRSPGQQPAVRARLLVPLCHAGGLSQSSLLTHQLYGMVSAVLLKACFTLPVPVVAVSPPCKLRPQARCFWRVLGNSPLVTQLVFLPFSSFPCTCTGPGFKLPISRNTCHMKSLHWQGLSRSISTEKIFSPANSHW